MTVCATVINNNFSVPNLKKKVRKIINHINIIIILKEPHRHNYDGFLINV